MTLFLNNDAKPKVFKTHVKIRNISNQTHYRLNYLTEFINQRIYSKDIRATR